MTWVDIALNSILSIMGLVIVSLFVWVIWIAKQYKHKFRIRDIVNGKTIIIDTKAMEYKDADGTLYWRLAKTREKAPLPPKEAIDIDTKGKKCVEAYRSAEGQFQYITCDGEISNDKVRFEPLQTNHRSILVNQIAKAHARKQKSWQDYIVPVTGLAVLGLIVIFIIIFWGDMAQPLLEMADKQAKTADLLNQAIEKMDVLINNRQAVPIDSTASAPG